MKAYIKNGKHYKIWWYWNRKTKSYQHKEPTANIDINKIIVSNKVSFDKNGFKLFIGYKDAKKFRALCIVLPKMTACRKDFDEIKYVFFDKRWWIIRII